MRTKGIRKSSYFLPLALTLLAFAVRLCQLNGQSLWYDEAFSWLISGMAWPIFWIALLSDGVHPPGYYLLLRTTLLLWGGSEFALRFLSVTGGTLAVTLIYQLGRTLGGRRLGLVTGLLLALNPFAVWYAQEARMYSLLLGLVIAGGYTFWKLLMRPSPSRWLWFTLVTMLSFVVHYFAFIVSLAQFLFLTVSLRQSYRALRWWVAAQVVAFLFFLPWAVALVMREGRNFGIGWISRPGLTDLPLTLSNLMFTLANPAGLWTWGGVILVVGMVGGAAFRGLTGRQNRDRPNFVLFLLVWLLTPLVFIWLISLKLPLYVDRQFIICLPPLLLLVSSLSLSKSLVARASVVVLVLISAAMVVRLWLDPDLAKEDWRGAAGVIQQAEQAGDVLVMNAAQTSFPFGYYYQGDLDLQLATFNRDTTPLEEFESGHNRLWLVYRRPFEATHNLARSATFNWQDEENPVLGEWLSGHESALVQEVTLPGVYIILYELSPN